MTARRREPLDERHEMSPPVRARDRVDLIHDDHTKIAKEPLDRGAGRDEHHLQGLGRRHQERRRLADEPAFVVVRDVTVPNEPPEPNHLGVGAEPLLLVVEERFERRDVQDPNPLGLTIHQTRERGEDGRFGLAARGRGQDHRVVAV